MLSKEHKTFCKQFAETNPTKQEYKYVKTTVRVCSYKAMILAIKLACTSEEHGASWHVDAHGERLRGEQGLGWEEEALSPILSQYCDGLAANAALKNIPRGVFFFLVKVVFAFCHSHQKALCASLRPNKLAERVSFHIKHLQSQFVQHDKCGELRW